MTHCQLIVRYLLEHDFITTLDAIDKLPKRCTRLSARVHDLKDEGIELDRVRQHNKDTWWVEYHLPRNMRERAKEWLKGGDGLRLKDGCLPKQ